MKILILGATGMLGHRLFIELSKHHEVWGTCKGWKQFLPDDRAMSLSVGAVGWKPRLKNVFENTLPDVVINCIAKVHPADNRFDKLACIEINATFPYELMYTAHEFNARLIHFSTDGVFSGNRGNYTEDDTPDGTDTYALTKRLGEITDQEHVLTLRCCPIGRELPLSAKHSLVEWFLAQTGEVKGYPHASFTPITTHEMARLLNDYILPQPDLHGIYHVGGRMPHKFSLLKDLAEVYGRDIEIVRDESVFYNRSLIGEKLFNNTGYTVPPIYPMLEEMAADNALYEKVAI